MILLRKNFILRTIFLIGISPTYSISAQANNLCRSLFEVHPQVESQNKQSLKKDFNSHFNGLIESLKNLKPTDILSSELVAEIENKLGPIEMSDPYDKSNIEDKSASSIFSKGNKIVLRFYAKVKSQNIVVFNLYFNKSNPNSVFLNNLRIENPLNTQDNLRTAQKNKGLPIREFNRTKNKIFEILKQNNFTQVRSSGAENLLVSYLYQRMGKMKPIGRFVEYNRLFDSYMKEEVLTLDQLNEAMGSISKVSPTDRIYKLELDWQRDPENFMNKNNMSPIHLNSQVIGFKDNVNSEIFLIDPLSPHKRFLIWSMLYMEESISLELDLNRQ